MINGVAQSRSPRRFAQAASIGSGAMAIRCIVVDDHPAVRLGVRELLAIEPDFEVLEAHATAEAALAFARRANFEVAVVDYQLGGHSGLWLSRKLKRLREPPAVVVYSAYSDYVLAAACVVAEVECAGQQGRARRSAVRADPRCGARRDTSSGRAAIIGGQHATAA